MQEVLLPVQLNTPSKLLAGKHEGERRGGRAEEAGRREASARARGRAGARGRRRTMASVVHFHFRNAKAQDMVKFEGDHVSLQDLKLLIAKKKGLAKAAEIDFAITNTETAEGAAAPPALRVRACARAPSLPPPHPARPPRLPRSSTRSPRAPAAAPRGRALRTQHKRTCWNAFMPSGGGARRPF